MNTPSAPKLKPQSNPDHYIPKLDLGPAIPENAFKNLVKYILESQMTYEVKRK